MNITLRVMGLELFALDVSTEDAEAEPDGSGTTASTFGFTAEGGRWQVGEDFGSGEAEDSV